MTESDQIPLPEPVKERFLHDPALGILVRDYLYSADQMRAFRAEGVAAAVAAERERCAKLCEELADKYQCAEGREYPELRSDAQAGASACENAIRNTKDQP